jgi:hypothetical protein
MKPSELARIVGMIESTSDLLKQRGHVCWKLSREWSGVSLPASQDGDFVRSSTLSDPTAWAALNRDETAKYHEQFIWLCVRSWELADMFTTSKASPELMQALMAVDKKKSINPDFLIPHTVEALNQAAQLLSEHGTAQLLTKSSRFVDHVNRMFMKVADLKAMIADLTQWVDTQGKPTLKKVRRERTITVCAERNCREDILDVPRKGRCPACYIWVRRWSNKNNGEPAPPVPKHIIERRTERRTGS